MKIRYKELLIILYMSLSPLVWFSSISLGPLKRVLLVFILILNYKFWTVTSLKGLHYFFIICILLLFSFSFSNTFNNADFTNVLLSVLEAYIFFLIGHNSPYPSMIDQQRSYNYIFFIPFIACFLTITNYVIGYPSWHAINTADLYDELYQRGYVIPDLYLTGFSWGRNGWGCSLAVLSPLCFLWDNRKYAIITWLVILVSVFLCSNRNGLLAMVLSIVAYFFFYLRYSHVNVISLPKIVIAFIIFIFLINSDFFVSNLRLDSDDVSSGRNFQYMLIPKMIAQMGFWGIGHHATADIISKSGFGEHVLHNVYFRVLIEYGWLVGLFLFVLVLNVLKHVKEAVFSKNKVEVVLSLILLNGLIVALFEPGVVFCSLGGYSIWWFAFGYLLKYHKKNNLI